MAGKNMILGGAEIAAAFMDLNLIDEYRIYVHPVVLGRGKEMFQSDKLHQLDLIEVK
ncbi:dihydrofolate reductase family protein [Cytobacillus horneckiae]|uniref:dihydrofolate reductase family protein n=1 Tax=Cytobacillus horneckiae TaxID=549687 RepID=UPI0030B83EFC